MRRVRRGARAWVSSIAVLLAVTGSVASAEPAKKAIGDECTKDDQCTGHCYLRQTDSKRVCVACRPDVIAKTRGAIADVCKVEGGARCDTFGPKEEAPAEFFSTRQLINTTCAKARRDENEVCWEKGDRGHQTAANSADAAAKKCENLLRDRLSAGLAYSCRDGDYKKLGDEVSNHCGGIAKAENTCAEFDKNRTKVDCKVIADRMKGLEPCLASIDELGKSCFPHGVSRSRSALVLAARKAIEHCKDVLAYKRSNASCK
jgi:hypothetical protein